MSIEGPRLLASAARGRQLAACMFCGDTQVTQEHLVADWAVRAFTRKRKPALLSARLGQGTASRILDEAPRLVAGLTCWSCNTGWISTLDRRASESMKPLIRGESVTLTPEEQEAAAAWIFKTALICDAADFGDTGRLAGLRAGFMGNRTAPGCNIIAGSTRPRGPAAFPFGVRAADGIVRVTVNVKSPDSEEAKHGSPRTITNPGFQVMVGAMTAFMWGRIAPVSLDALTGFEHLWPSSGKSITIEPT